MPPLLLPLVAWVAACEPPIAPERVTETAARARAAFSSLDVAGFEAAARDLDELIPCLAAPLAPAQAADIHMVSALRAFVANEENATVQALQAAAAADPSADPAAWLPPRHPFLLERRYALRLAEDAPRDLRVPRGSQVWIDGREASSIVTSRPAVIQQASPGAALASTSWAPGAALPPGIALVERRVPIEVERRLWLGSTTAVMAGAAVGMALWSSGLRDEFRDPSTPYSELDTVLDTNRAATVAAAGSGLAALGLGTALVLTW